MEDESLEDSHSLDDDNKGTDGRNPFDDQGTSTLFGVVIIIIIIIIIIINLTCIALFLKNSIALNSRKDKSKL